MEIRPQQRAIALVGDGIENPANVRLLQSVAQLFEADCMLRLASEARAMQAEGYPLLHPTTALIERPDGLVARYPTRIAFDNLPGAVDVYGHRAGAHFAVMVGNERRGLTPSFTAAATEAVQIPMHSVRITSLNVAAAAAVALYILVRAPLRPMQIQRNHNARRPGLLLTGVREHFELGSAVRSAAAFGWNQVFVEDTEKVWFGVDRARHAEGRAAARRVRNDIRLLPCSSDTNYPAEEAVIVTPDQGTALHRVDLARGERVMLVLPALNNATVMQQDWGRLARKITFASLQLPAATAQAPFRLYATIALAECARQIGRADARGRGRTGHQYDFSVPLIAGSAGEVINVDELAAY